MNISATASQETRLYSCSLLLRAPNEMIIWPTTKYLYSFFYLSTDSERWNKNSHLFGVSLGREPSVEEKLYAEISAVAERKETASVDDTSENMLMIHLARKITWKTKILVLFASLLWCEEENLKLFRKKNSDTLWAVFVVFVKFAVIKNLFDMCCVWNKFETKSISIFINY